MLKSLAYSFLQLVPESNLSFTKFIISPVGSTTKGQEGEKRRWKRTSQTTYSVRMPEYWWFIITYLRPNSFKICFIIFVWLRGLSLSLSIAQILLHLMPWTSSTNFDISCLNWTRSSVLKYPRKQIDAAKMIQSPNRHWILLLIWSNFLSTFNPYSLTLDRIYLVLILDISATSIF